MQKRKKKKKNIRGKKTIEDSAFRLFFRPFRVQ